MAGIVNVEANFTPEEVERTDKCYEEIKPILEKWKCTIAAYPYIDPQGRTFAEAHFVPVREEKQIETVKPRLLLPRLLGQVPKNGG